MKMLIMKPDIDIVIEMVNNEEFKYVRILAALYIRLTGTPKLVYEILEPLYNDYRKVRKLSKIGWEITTVDRFIESLLYDEAVIGIALPNLPKRKVLEETRVLSGVRESLLRGENESSESGEDGSSSSSSSSSDGSDNDDDNNDNE